MQIITVPRWFDRHLHLRDGIDPGQLLHTVLPCTLNSRATGAVCMGNLKEPVTTITRAINYRGHISSLIPSDSDFKPLMVCYLTDTTTPEEVVKGFEDKVWYAVKLMMTRSDGTGGTTGSAHAVTDLLSRYPIFAAMEKVGMPLLGHWESVDPDVDEFDREIIALEKYLKPILQAFPGLKVVFEHVSDSRAADFVARGLHKELYATVTPHHLLLNQNALFTGGMNPGHFCKPIIKAEKHRRILARHVTSGNPRFGAGTDSAPHPEASKTKVYGNAAGIFSAPTALATYTEVFDKAGAIEHLGNFLSSNFLNIYGMEVCEETMTLEKTPNSIPEKIGNVWVFRGGKELQWRLKE